jgi:thioredoxin-dependent peroxiredoxin
MKTLIIIVMATVVSSLAASGQSSLSVGDKAPAFSATADDGTVWDLSHHVGSKYIVVYFYPAAFTGGCTAQACSYRDHSSDLQKSGVEVVGVSGDKVEGLKLFKQAENINFPLLSDDKGIIAKAFGVPVSDGGTVKGTVGQTEHEIVRGVTEKRWTFIIGKDGKIIYKNESVNPGKDPEEVLAFINSLPGNKR